MNTATKAKRKYNEKAYERIVVFIKAGEKEKIKQRAEELGKSINAYITDLIYEDMKKEG